MKFFFCFICDDKCFILSDNVTREVYQAHASVNFYNIICII
uniref:Uncharacterized protein n=1 Tax=Anguilla anguilla TaxID=7936 RepID=A0A0E9SV18_ANGAN